MKGPEFDIKNFAKFVENNHKVVVAIIMALTLGCLFFLPAIKFQTDLEAFFPDNEVVDSNDRVEDYFGHDPAQQYMDITRIGYDGNKEDITLAEDNIFDLNALREQYNVSKLVLGYEGVEAVIGLAIGIQERLEERNLTIMEADIPTIKEALLNSSDGTLSSSTIEYYTYLRNLLLDKYSVFELNGLQILLDEALSKDYSPYPPFALRTLVIVQINSSIPTKERKELANNIREDVNAMELDYIKVRHTSSDLMSYDVDEASNQSIIYLGALIIGSIIVILYLNFRDSSYVLFSLLTLIVAVIWTMATLVILGMEFTALEVAVIPLIIGIGIDDSVHFARRYLEERHNKREVGEAISVTFRSIGMAIFLTSLTTAIAFLSNATSDVKPVREFGFVCAFGIIYAFILTITFHLSLRYWLDSKRVAGKKREKGLEFFGRKKENVGDLDSFMAKAASTIHRYPLSVIIIAVLLTLGCVIQSSHLETEFDVREFLPEDFETYQTGKTINTEYEGGTFTTAYVLVEDEDVATVDTILAVDRTSINIMGMKDDRFVNLEKIFPLLDNVLVVMDKAIEENDTLSEKYHFELSQDDDHWIRDHYIPSAGTSDQDIKDFFNYLLNNHTAMSDILGLSYSEAMGKLLYKDGNGKFTATLIKLSVRSQTNEHARTIHNELKKDVTGFVNGEKTSVTGFVILLVVTSDTLQESQVQATTVSVILAFTILLLVFKGDLKLSLIGIIPVVFSTLWILGFMVFSTYLNHGGVGWMPIISLNVLTVTVTSLSIGLGIDFAIHVIERFREDLALEHTGVNDSIKSTLEHTGSALLISALTTIVGFGVLIMSPMPIVRSYGLITSIIIFFSFISATLVLPVFLMYWAVSTGKFQDEAEELSIRRMLKERWKLLLEKKDAFLHYLSRREERLQASKKIKGILDSEERSREKNGEELRLISSKGSVVVKSGVRTSSVKEKKEQGDEDEKDDHILISK